MNSRYIHEFRELDEVLESSSMIDRLFDEWNKSTEDISKKRDMFLFMNESTEDLDLYMESEDRNFFQKIGDAIITLVNKFCSFVDTIIEKATSLFRTKKNTSSEIEAMKNHPELAESFMNGIKDGSIKYSDYENIDEMLDTAEKIIKELDSGKIDKETGIQKFNKMVTKFNDNLKPSTELLHTVSGAAKDIKDLGSFKTDLYTNIVKGTKAKRQMETLKNNAKQRLMEMQKEEDEADAKKNNTPVFYTHRYEKKLARTWDLKVMQMATAEYSKTMSKYYEWMAAADDKIGKFFVTKKNSKPVTLKDAKSYGTLDRVKEINDMDAKSNTSNPSGSKNNKK